MQLIGYLDSPFVRRVAITAKVLGIELEHKQISVIREYDRIKAINPLAKVPTLVTDDGQVLVDSTLIIDYLVSANGNEALMPSDESNYVAALNLIGTALVAMEKTVFLVYETKHRPEDAGYQPWIDRCRDQLGEALHLLETAVGDGENWLFGNELTQADISIAVACRFTEFQFPDAISSAEYPGLARFSERAEALPEFESCAF